MKAYPLKFRPIYKQRIWGGQKLYSGFGKELPAGEKISESWELTDLPEDKSATRTADKPAVKLVVSFLVHRKDGGSSIFSI